MTLSMRVLAVNRKTGTGKTSGKPYDMTELTLIDTEKPRCKTVFGMTVSDDDRHLCEGLEDEVILVQVESVKAGFRDSVELRGRFVLATQAA